MLLVVFLNQLCKTYCSGLGKYWYATQYGKECWCGDESVDIDKYGSATCNYPCAGDPTTYCGGYNAFTAYKTGKIGRSLTKLWTSKLLRLEIWLRCLADLQFCLVSTKQKVICFTLSVAQLEITSKSPQAILRMSVSPKFYAQERLLQLSWYHSLADLSLSRQHIYAFESLLVDRLLRR